MGVSLVQEGWPSSSRKGMRLETGRQVNAKMWGQPVEGSSASTSTQLASAMSLQGDRAPSMGAAVLQSIANWHGHPGDSTAHRSASYVRVMIVGRQPVCTCGKPI